MACSMVAKPLAAGSVLGPNASFVSERRVGPLAMRVAKFDGLKAQLLRPASVSNLSPFMNVWGSSRLNMAATLPLYNFAGEKTGELELDLKVARPETARSVVHRGVVTELTNRRQGTASTLTRAEVRGGGRKPFKQKGTGQARMGSKRTPLRPGGGVVFGPKPKDWSIKINKKEKRLAISTALQSAAENALVVEDLNDKFTQPKTRDFVSALTRWGVGPREHMVLFTEEVSEAFYLSTRNLKTVKLITPRSLNLYDILRADKLVLTTSGLAYLNDVYGSVTEVPSGDSGSIESAAADK
eukprot:TRINITY_DN23588_c0_g1_i1.p1 TRINITY_DN23588_c0_g1~~TRINITY_DN23588_c0_g1_i1.p1  ORF type:complete len:298 (-),score=46.39 TRINITY_DN23588_c0_g1_i1:126-1019(-)